MAKDNNVKSGKSAARKASNRRILTSPGFQKGKRPTPPPKAIKKGKN